MPFVVTPSYSVSSSSAMTTTVQNVIDAVSQDIRKVLASTGADATILIDYCNRVNLEMLRASRWDFLRSAPQHFLTQKGQTDYWIGTTGSGPTGSVDTGLNLSDLHTVLEGSVYDRSNFRQLMRGPDAPLVQTVLNVDQSGAQRGSQPTTWRETADDPYTLHLYPAPDNQNTYQPVPVPPYCTTTTSGALSSRTYYVRLSYVDSAGNEGAAGDEAIFYVPANKVLVVQSPSAPLMGSASGITYTNYKVYVSTSSNSETLQSTSVTLGSNWTEPNGGLVVGTAYPTASNIEPMRGYLIEFCYQKAAYQLTSASQYIQVPDIFKDVFIAGVNAYTAEYLKLAREAQTWFGIYNTGVRGMVRSRNLQPHSDFLRPDGAARL